MADMICHKVYEFIMSILSLYRNVFNEDIDPVPAAAPVSEPQGSSSSDEFISVYI